MPYKSLRTPGRVMPGGLVMVDNHLTLERSRFVDDLLSYMTLEEKLGQLDLFHPGDDPGLEKATVAGRVGGVAGAVSTSRLQALATEHSRLGIPLLFAGEQVTLALSPWALAASWDPELARSVGAAAARDTIGGGYNCIRAPRTAQAPDGSRADVHLAAGDPYLSAQLAAAFAAGSWGVGQDRRSAVLAVPEWVGSPDAEAVAWSRSLIRADDAAAYDCAAFDRVAAQRAGFSGILIAECQRIAAIVRRQFSITSARSALESAERAVADGAVSEVEIDMAVRGVLAAKHGLGLFRDPQRIVAPPAAGPVYSRDDEKVRATFVLLRNEAGILPLSPVSDRVLVVGAADGAGGACAGALERAGIGHSVAPGLAQRRAGETWSAPAAGDHFALSVTCDAARRADFVLVVLESRHFSAQQGDGWHRPSAAALAMLRALSLAGARLVAIVATVEPVDLADADQYFAAVLHCWRPTAGFEEALCDVLSGRFSPQGRMPASAGRFLFGHGLGFGESVLSGYAVAMRRDHVAATVRVRNSGSFATRETVQVYARGLNDRPRLLGFQHVMLVPGEEASLAFELGLEDLGMPAADGRIELTPGRYEISLGKSVDRLLTATLDITPAMARAIGLRERAFLRLATG